MEPLIFDTTFLIDVQRERARDRESGPAHVFLQTYGDTPMHVPAIALGELAEGFSTPSHPVLTSIAEHCEILDVDRETALRYGVLARHLRIRGSLIGANDMWIAATALRHGRGLVTRNTGHFERVPDLKLVTY